MENILDITEDERESPLLNANSWISLIILWIGITTCIYYGVFRQTKTVIAIVLLVIATLVNYRNWKTGVKFTTLLIVLGTLNLISFFPISYNISFAIGWLSIGFEFILFGIGLIHYFTNHKILSPYVKGLLTPTEEDLKAEARLRINGFKNRFANKTISELKNIVDQNALVPEAINAAKELLEEEQSEGRNSRSN